MDLYQNWDWDYRKKSTNSIHNNFVIETVEEASNSQADISVGLLL